MSFDPFSRARLRADHGFEMHAFEVTYLGRSRFHQHQDATAMYFRVTRAGLYVGAYAGAIAGPEMVAVQARPTRRFWAALARCTTTAIGVRLLSGARSEGKLHDAETIWIKATDLKSHAQETPTLPVEDRVYRTFQLDEDPIAERDEPTQARILSAGSSSISLKAAATSGPKRVDS